MSTQTLSQALSPGAGLLILALAIVIAAIIYWLVRRSSAGPAKAAPRAGGESPANDVLNIGGDLLPEIDEELDRLLERGKRERVMLLAGTESPTARQKSPYAVSKVKISFTDEAELRTCVRLLRWSDERLRARPEQLLRWEWERTFREGMDIYFGVNWYEREFFERRKDAFTEPQHASYYAYFGATPDRFKIDHEVLGKE
jgi:hypothetical protein